ncbi:MAG: CBO0543 family protein [Candidatus Limiplasma sp.]|nr:CBO0543 family protein [Candidatus Limiplasma sp.]
MRFESDLLEAVDRISLQYEEIHNEIQRIWMEEMVFTWHWWLDVALSVLPWILWFIVRDRKNTHNLLYAGFFSMLTATLLDIMGISQGVWNYNTWLLPYLPEYLPWDLTVMPVTAMLFYQFYPKVSPWIKGVVFGAVAAYVVEPIFIWVGVYEPSGWEHHYSLPIYFVIYMIGNWLYTRKRNQ